jgi:hypothetical protein
MYSGACRLNVMHHSVFENLIAKGCLCDGREFSQQLGVWVSVIIAETCNTHGWFVWADDTLDLQLRGGVDELAASKVHQQTKVIEKVGAQDWLWDVGDYKNP